MTFLESLYLWSIAKGMATTLKHLFRKKATIEYPEEKRPFSPVFRGLHVLNRDAEGRENCTACGLCAVACPAEAITMEAADDPEFLVAMKKARIKKACDSSWSLLLLPVSSV